MATSLLEQCWALAGIAQASTLVHGIARGRTPDEDATSALFRALLSQNPNTLASLTELGDFSYGVRAGRGMLNRPDDNQIQTLRYVLAIMDATARLRKQAPVVARLTAGVDRLAAKYLPEIDGTVSQWAIPWQELADIYVDTLGSLNQRVQVKGSPSVLQRPDVAAQIRACLLMGVRFAWLWHQLGGRRWHLLVSRRKLRDTFEKLEQLL